MTQLSMEIDFLDFAPDRHNPYPADLQAEHWAQQKLFAAGFKRGLPITSAPSATAGGYVMRYTQRQEECPSAVRRLTEILPSRPPI